MQGNISKSKDRMPAVAGKFYSSDPDKLQQELTSLFTSAVSKQGNHVRAILSPHAGYIYSGKVAASAFNQIDTTVNYKRVFVIASSHHLSFDKAAVYCDGDFIMPYGKEIVDTGFGRMLAENNPDIFTSNPDAHQKEHSLEVQLPFLHYILKSYCIVPIVIGTSNPEVCKRIASVLKPYLTDENLFIISSDFSHYPEYADARKVDADTKDAILSNDPKVLLATLAENRNKHIPHLATSLCGWASVLTLLYMTASNDSLEYHAIDYNNSGDVKYYGESNRVVGYWGISLTERQAVKDDFQLTQEDKEMLLAIARNTLNEHCRHNSKYIPDPAEVSTTLQTNCGAFVSLHKKGKLRGCIGRLTGNLPLYKMVQEMTISAASHDRRFMPVDPEELPDIELEISVLSPLKRINDMSEIKLGIHGIYIEAGFHTGVFLPQVASETGWSKEEFLGHCARDKAGLDWDGWKTAHLFIFTATVFSEQEHVSV